MFQVSGTVAKAVFAKFDGSAGKLLSVAGYRVNVPAFDETAVPLLVASQGFALKFSVFCHR